ncbi:MAG TPA: 3-oxoacyl-[acyl-carrier-protein] synthase III C-terminal domain-containing protein, partial [Steroidobacteraceae bacterium]
MDIPMQILGTGEHVPRRRVDSTEFDRRWGKDEGWTRSQTGVRSRAFLSGDETAITMGLSAARQALDFAGIEAAQLDAIICVGSVPYQLIPCTAAFLQRALQLQDSGIAAFDINATCLGFIVALDLVAQGIATGRYRTVLIVASEPASIGIDWEDPATAGLFGDGAGAVVLGAPRRPGAVLCASHVQTFSVGLEFCQIRAGGTGRYPRVRGGHPMEGTAFEMQGRPTYKLAAERFPAFVEQLLARARVRLDEVGIWVPHQASGHALAHLQALLRVPADRMMLTIGDVGNQVSASV